MIKLWSELPGARLKEAVADVASSGTWHGECSEICKVGPLSGQPLQEQHWTANLQQISLSGDASGGAVIRRWVQRLI